MRKLAVMTAARALYAEHGFETVSVDDVVKTGRSRPFLPGSARLPRPREVASSPHRPPTQTSISAWKVVELATND